jgi:hypothetical protein
MRIVDPTADANVDLLATLERGHCAGEVDKRNDLAVGR